MAGHIGLNRLKCWRIVFYISREWQHPVSLRIAL
jgi:hypothetical protein